ncbi:MAG TPA: preprotein translocase subunit SecE [Anaerolineaceae bacterium]
MVEKVNKAKEPEKVKAATATQPEKARTPEKDNGKVKPKQPNAIVRWWRETRGELAKVTWPTPQDAWRLTKIVLIIMGLMALLLGIMDFLFSTIFTRLLV